MLLFKQSYPNYNELVRYHYICEPQHTLNLGFDLRLYAFVCSAFICICLPSSFKLRQRTKRKWVGGGGYKYFPTSKVPR
jgi:hypothetical protein